MGSPPKPWAQELYLCSAWCLQSLLEPCWRSAGLQLGHSHVPAWLQSPAALNPSCGLVSWLDLGPVTSLWICLVITGPGPDLWIDFLASPWTCLIAVTLPFEVDSWLDLATWPSLGLVSSLRSCGTGCGWWGPFSRGILLSSWLPFPEGAALLLLLSHTSHEIINLIDTSCMMRRGQ